jgi:uncharacterized protein
MIRTSGRWMIFTKKNSYGLDCPLIVKRIKLTYNIMSPQPQPNPEILKQLVTMKMPFGKYKDVLLCNLPVSYLEWFQRKGFPQGKLGILLGTIYEIKINGLEQLLQPLKGM